MMSRNSRVAWHGWGLLLVLLAAFAPLARVHADDSERWHFSYNGPESAQDLRYQYHWRVLRAALDATRGTYGDYVVEPGVSLNERLQLFEMQRPNGRLNIIVRNPTVALEQALQPIKVPIDKGLLGYRVFLIRAQDASRFAAVQSLDDLRQFSFGQGRDWSDVAIYAASGLKVITGSSYEGLFGMLMLHRFDAFGRGVSEVAAEFKQAHQQYPQLLIENELLLYYPLPVYFWFPRTAEGDRHAQRVAEGMALIVANGTLDRLFNEEYGAVIKAMHLHKRRIFKIANPNLSADQPFANKAYWFVPSAAQD
jgi:hypothetical protein